MWSVSEWLARNASRAHRELAVRHRRRLRSDTDAPSSSGSSGLRSLLPTCSSSSTDAAQDTHSAVIISNSATICAVKSASSAAAAHAGVGLHRQHIIQHSTPSRLFSTAAARVRSLAAAFEMSQTTSISSQPPSPSASTQLGDVTDSEADAAVLIASRCVKQLTETWETYSAGGSAVNSECSTPTASFSHQKPSSRPVTPAAAPANIYIADALAVATPNPSDTSVVVGGGGAAGSRVSVDPAATVLQCWRQESGQCDSIMELLLLPAAQQCQQAAALTVGRADATVAAAAAEGPLRSLNNSSWAKQSAAGGAEMTKQPVSSEEWGSAVCRAAVFAGLVSFCAVAGTLFVLFMSSTFLFLASPAHALANVLA